LIIYDFEVTKHDWLVCYLDTDLRKEGVIVNNKSELEEFYKKYKDTIFIGYNSRGFDQWVLKGILAGFNPYEITDWIINKDRRGYEFSNLLNNFPLLNYDTSVGFRSLKELEAFMGHDIRESNIPFDIDRKLTDKELEEMIKYCKHDVWETFEVFVETKGTFETIIGLLQEFNLPITDIGKTETQLSAKILGAVQKKWKDEHDIQFQDRLVLNRYSEVKEWFRDRAKEKTDFSDSLDIFVSGVPTRYAWGGVHGAKPKYFGKGFFVLSDINSMYPSMMIQYNLLSRNVFYKEKFKTIYDERFKLKAEKNPRQERFKLILNKAYGGSLDKYNPLYDPRNGRSVCINGQLALTMLIERIEHMCEVININTDGILVKLHSEDDFPEYKRICDEWEKESLLGLGHDIIDEIYQKDVNNAIFKHRNGKVKSIGAWVKPLSRLDYHLPIVNKAIKAYFLEGISPEEYIGKETRLMEFQFITKVSNKYDYAVHGDKIMYNKIYRVFASKFGGATLYKKHKNKDTLDKTAGTPESCRIENGNVTELKVPYWLDRSWYIDLANQRIKEFLGE